MEARTKTRRQLVWEDYAGVREFKVLGYKTGPGDSISPSGELFLSVENDLLVIDADRMLVTWLDADPQDFGETVDCYFELGSRPEIEVRGLHIRRELGASV